MMGEGKVDEKDKEKLKEALGWLETFLGDAPYMAGDRMTIADYSLTASISSIEVNHEKIWLDWTYCFVY